jgi:hypothetical protein
MSSPAEDPEAYKSYYYGLPGMPPLLARSSTSPWKQPTEELDDGFNDGPTWIRKMWYYPIRLLPQDGDLRDNIRRVFGTMSPCRWISVDYNRLGYDSIVVKNNPVVILVTVEAHQVPRGEAQRIVDCLADECRK